MHMKLSFDNQEITFKDLSNVATGNISTAGDVSEFVNKILKPFHPTENTDISAADIDKEITKTLHATNQQGKEKVSL